MNKNLKKVISAVAVLAMSASSLVALAARYPDVADTASYAQAVEELSVLGVVEGYEDGTFGPETNVTRAEFATMTVRALGEKNVQSANSKAEQNTQFADVPGTHWAAGYVQEGVDQGFINGYSDTEFGPGDNITYAQAVKMLVCAVGYDYFALQSGGWPSGYLGYGVRLGITNGVEINSDEIITRAQVAQLIDNALKVPIAVMDYTTTDWGTAKATYDRKDETSTTVKDSWQCLLNYGHDIYDVYGRVIETPQSGGTKNDQVRVRVEKSNNFDGYQITSTGNYKNTTTEAMYIGTSGADKQLFSYAELLVKKDDDGEFTVLSINPQGTNVSKSFNASDYDRLSSGTLYAYENGQNSKSVSSKLDINNIYGGTAGGFYVNGKAIALDGNDLEDKINEYIYNNPTGTVTLIDSPDEGKSSADGSYDYIMVTKYADAIVDSVRVSSETEATVYFSDADGIPAQWTVDTDDEDVTYDITLNGSAISVADLQENDVVSIAYDVVEGFQNSNTYTALVSRNPVSGTVQTVNPDGERDIEDEYVLSDGNTYKVASTALVSALSTGDDYTLYLNAFGRIAKAEVETTSKLIGIIDAVYAANGDQYYANIITKTGEKINVTIKDQTKYESYYEKCYNKENSNKKFDIQDRVYEYTLNGKNELTIKNQSKYRNTDNTSGLIYKASTNKLGAYTINDSLTSILDTAEYADGTITAMSSSAFDNDQEYDEVYVYDRNSDGSYSFILVNANGTGYTVETEFVVYSKWGTTSTEDGNKNTIYAYADGENTTSAFILADEVADEDFKNLQEGDLVLLKKNSSSEVTEILTIFADKGIVKGNTAYADLVAKAMPTTFSATALDDMIAPAKTWAHDISYNSDGSKKKHYADYYFGPIVDKTDAGVTLGEYNYGERYVTNKNTLEDLAFANNVKVYVYDFGASSNVKVSAGVKGSIVKTQVNSSNYIASDDGAISASDKSLIDWSSFEPATGNYGVINYALVKTVDDDVTEVYVIIPSASRR